ncbi:MAG: hypothetical protein E3J54_05990, partial [Actinobacteria bacterium]
MLKRSMPKIFKNHYFIAFIILVAALMVAFSNIVFLGKTLTTSSLTVGTTRNGPYLYDKDKPLLPITDGGASAWHFEPAIQLNNQAIKKWELPLWNPYNGAGQPLAADMQSSSFSPLTLPLNLSPTPVVWDIFLLLRLLIAGLLTFAFLRLINIKTVGAIAGAITFMLSGYLMFFINMAHLNVEILVPLMLISVEFIHRKINPLSIFLLIFTSALVALGGMPEAAMLNFSFAFTYFVYRSFQGYKEDKKGLQVLTRSTYFLFGIIAGLMISSIGWLPFVEYSRIFWSNHMEANKGIISLDPRHFIQYLSPVFIGVRNATYVGVIPLFLSIVTKKEHKQKWFFAIAALIIGLKLFGIGVNWLGYLPIINRVFLFKYGQVLFAISISVLTAMAIDGGLKTSLWRVILLVPVWLGALYYFLTNAAKLFNVKQLRLDHYASLSVKWALLFLAICILLVLIPRLFKKIKVSYIAIATTLLIFLELWAHIPSGRAVRHDPYIAPPFVKYLQKQKGEFRTHALHA